MLLLDRRAQETIAIGDNIVVTIVRIDGNTVRVGIDAPKNIPILRDNAKVRVPKQREAALV